MTRHDQKHLKQATVEPVACNHPLTEGWAESLMKHECTAWIRYRIEQERAEAESADDDTPVLLKGWKKLR